MTYLSPDQIIQNERAKKSLETAIEKLIRAREEWDTNPAGAVALMGASDEKLHTAHDILFERIVIK